MLHIRFSLMNPGWEFAGSVYFGCRQPHLPLELLYSEAVLRQGGHDVQLIDAHFHGLGVAAVKEEVARFRPDRIVVTTAPTYLFWRCPQPELTVPARLIDALRGLAPIFAVGPHASATPLETLHKLRCDGAVRGEPEGVLPSLARADWRSVPSVAHISDGLFVDGDHPTVTDMSMLPALDFGSYPIERYTHLHGYFGPWKPEGPAAQMELSRGCPYICTYCNRGTFRHAYRHRPLEKIAAEMETLKRRGVQYVYFVDEMFGLGASRQVLRGIAERPLFRFGIQSRLDTWNEEGLDLLARAGCIAVEFGLESPIFDSIRPFNKRYRFSPERALSLLSYAKGRIDWVQVNLVRPPDQPQAQREEVAQWRGRMIDEGIWVSEPVPLYPYPGSEWHEQLFGPIDAHSWERAHDYYLGRYERWTSLQDCSPSPLDELEHGGEGSLCTF